MFLIISLLESRIKLTIINNATLQHGWLLNISSAYIGCPRKNVPLEEGRTSAKGTFFLGHLVGCLVKS